MEKDQLLEEFAAAYERLLKAALFAAQHSEARPTDGWGPREVVAHLTGWEVMATVRIPPIVAGTPPMEFSEATQARVMNDALNAAFVAMAGDQPLDTLCGMLGRAYRRTAEILAPLDEGLFRPGNYVYERTKSVIDHCQEHIDVHLSTAR
jgi:hypothetical protein